jgi:hypothetical protein
VRQRKNLTAVAQDCNVATQHAHLTAANEVQYVVRPPEMSKVAAVEKEHSSLANQQTRAAHSAASPNLPIGMRDRM